MMRHKKSEHSNVVKECIKEKNNECTHGEKDCWFKHVNENTYEKIYEKGFDEKPLKIFQTNRFFKMFVDKIKKNSRKRYCEEKKS